MTTLSDQDWELVNADHDGEMSSDLRKTYAKRLAAEPDLRAALDSVRHVSGSLKALRPQPAEIGPKTTRIWKPLAMTAMAASIAGLVIVAVTNFSVQPGIPQTPIQWHQAFLENAYAPSNTLEVQNAGFFGSSGIPDLEPAGLTLVEQRSGQGNEFAAHYVGRNLCRLTVITAPSLGQFAVPQDALSSTWSVGERQYAVIATRMDQMRFDAIATYVRQISEQGLQPQMVVAMQDATAKAAPCGDKPRPA
jgi:anti-sigma factor RsiW